MNTDGGVMDRFGPLPKAEVEKRLNFVVEEEK